MHFCLKIIPVVIFVYCLWIVPDSFSLYAALHYHDGDHCKPYKRWLLIHSLATIPLYFYLFMALTAIHSFFQSGKVILQSPTRWILSLLRIFEFLCVCAYLWISLHLFSCVTEGTFVGIMTMIQLIVSIIRLAVINDKEWEKEVLFHYYTSQKGEEGEGNSLIK